jgi:hypothetical protein
MNGKNKFHKNNKKRVLIKESVFTFLKAYIVHFQTRLYYNLTLFGENRRNHLDGLVFEDLETCIGDHLLMAALPETASAEVPLIQFPLTILYRAFHRELYVPIE